MQQRSDIERRRGKRHAERVSLLEADLAIHPEPRGQHSRHRNELRGEIDAGHPTAMVPGEVACRTADPRSDLEQMHARLEIKSGRESRRRRSTTMVKLIHWCEVIWIEPVWIFPRLTQRGENPLFEGALSVVARDIRFDTHDSYPPGSIHKAFEASLLQARGRTAILMLRVGGCL
jgi:hypothetical protein